MGAFYELKRFLTPVARTTVGAEEIRWHERVQRGAFGKTIADYRERDT